MEMMPKDIEKDINRGLIVGGAMFIFFGLISCWVIFAAHPEWLPGWGLVLILGGCAIGLVILMSSVLLGVVYYFDAGIRGHL